jgi:hypothetical protein
VSALFVPMSPQAAGVCQLRQHKPLLLCYLGLTSTQHLLFCCAAPALSMTALGSRAACSVVATAWSGWARLLHAGISHSIARRNSMVRVGAAAACRDISFYCQAQNSTTERSWPYLTYWLLLPGGLLLAAAIVSQREVKRGPQCVSNTHQQQ